MAYRFLLFYVSGIDYGSRIELCVVAETETGYLKDVHADITVQWVKGNVSEVCNEVLMGNAGFPRRIQVWYRADSALTFHILPWICAQWPNAVMEGKSAREGSIQDEVGRQTEPGEIP